MYTVDGFEVSNGFKIHKDKQIVFPMLQKGNESINALQILNEELAQ